uniref:Uncharacterized protein n=1 Tax=viral metagenome TaxID=1070528 RepID=A0A6C0DQP5_9ZZZZ
MDDNKRIEEYVTEKNIQPRPIMNFIGFYNDDDLASLKNRSNEIREVLLPGYLKDIAAATQTVECLKEKEKNPGYNANCYSLQIPSKAKKTETISEQIKTETQKLNALVREGDALSKEYNAIIKVLNRHHYALGKKKGEIADTEGSFFKTVHAGSKKRRHRKKTHKKKFNKNKSKKLR